MFSSSRTREWTKGWMRMVPGWQWRRLHSSRWTPWKWSPLIHTKRNIIQPPHIHLNIQLQGFLIACMYIFLNPKIKFFRSETPSPPNSQRYSTSIPYTDVNKSLLESKPFLLRDSMKPGFPRTQPKIRETFILQPRANTEVSSSTLRVITPKFRNWCAKMLKWGYLSDCQYLNVLYKLYFTKIQQTV